MIDYYHVKEDLYTLLWN